MATTGWGRFTRTDMQKAVTNIAVVGTYTTAFLSLHTGNPGDDGQTANEVTTTTSGYARQTLTWTVAAYTSVSADGPAVASNSNAISFGPSTGANAAWGTITHMGIWSASSGTTETTFRGRVAASVSQSVSGSGVTITVAIGAVAINLTPT